MTLDPESTIPAIRSVHRIRAARSSVCGHEITISGRILRVGKLRHEWCEFIEDLPHATGEMRELNADLFTFVREITESPLPSESYFALPVAVAVLPVTTYDTWWDEIGYKTRNKLRKGLKSGVEFREVKLDDDFARGVASIYNETPIKQGRRFYHYGKSPAEIMEELDSFRHKSILVGAYFDGQLVGFMKLFRGQNVLRTIHIIASIRHRDKNVMDILIAKAVELCSKLGFKNLQYGSWTSGGIETFRVKHGFQRVELPRYFVPLNLRGQLMLNLKLHQPLRDRLPQKWIGPMIALRTRWNAFNYRSRPRTFVF